MNKNKFKMFSYKGRKFILTENTVKPMLGYSFKANGVNCISINRDLPEREKQLVFHRLITGRGLRGIVKRKLKFS